MAENESSTGYAGSGPAKVFARGRGCATGATGGTTPRFDTVISRQ
jgi:hypothetical protein